MRDGVKFSEGTPNPKRKAAKKSRGFGQGSAIPPGVTDNDEQKRILDAWCQSHDPLYKVKGKKRHRRLKMR